MRKFVQKASTLLMTLLMLLTFVSCGENKVLSSNTIDENLLPKLVKEFDRTSKIENGVLFEQNGVKIESEEITFDSNNLTLNVKITNNTNGLLEFSCGSAAYHVNSINDVMISDGFLSCEVDENSSISECIEFDIEELVMQGFSNVCEIEIGFWVTGEHIDNFETGVLKLKTNQNTNCEESAFQKIVNDGIFSKMTGCKIEYISRETIYSDDNLGFNIDFGMIIRDKEDKLQGCIEITNQTNDEIVAWVKELKINDILVKENSLFVESINDGKRCVVMFDITEYINEYEDNSQLSLIDKLEFTMSYGENSWSADVTENINFDFSKAPIELMK